MNMIVGARDTSGVTHRFHVTDVEPDEMPQAIEAVREQMEGMGAKARVILVGLQGGKA